MRRPLLTASFVLAASSCSATTVEVTKAYSCSNEEFASRDAACVAAMLDEITPNFDGLQQVALSTNSIVRTQSGYLAIYPAAKFESRFGDAEGSLTCLFDPDGRDVTEVTVTFEGRGLAGFKKHPLARTIGDPAQKFSMGLSSSIFHD